MPPGMPEHVQSLLCATMTDQGTGRIFLVLVDHPVGVSGAVEE